MERVVTFPQDDPAFTNNVWLIGNDEEVLVVDAAHHAHPIVEAVAGRQVKAIVCTHGHWDHVNAVAGLAEAVGAPVYLHPADEFLWDQVVPFSLGFRLTDDQRFEVAGLELRVLHTPGHTPGSVCLDASELGAVFTGDTLFPGGPGATRWEYSDFGTILASITDRLLVLPGDTAVLPGHGDATTIAAESAERETWKP
ncbi:MAG: MBL fold metallo-hydrolase [Propionibacteriaceae bacterium]|nr:MBL fold metallo-hydrolase [Propionibacteriaceae bacterium]